MSIKWNQYPFAGPYKTAERAVDSMYDSLADGEIDRSQNPEVIALRDHRGRITGYGVFLTDTSMTE